MEAVVELSSGVVDGIYVLVLEVFVLGLLFRAVESLTWQMGKRSANERGELKLFRNRWTDLLGRGSTLSGHVLRAAVSAVCLAAVLMIIFGTNGFTLEKEIPANEVVYMTKTSDVDAQQRFFLRNVQSNSAAQALWAALLEPCWKQSIQGTTRFSSYCETPLCTESFRNGGDTLPEEDYTRILDDAQRSFRCNNGRDAPEVILAQTDTEFASITLEENYKLEYGEDSWRLVDESEMHRLFVLEDTLGEDHALDGLSVACARILYPQSQSSVQNCILSEVEQEGEAMMFGTTFDPERQEWADREDGEDLAITIDLNALTILNFTDPQPDFLGTNHTKWMTTLNIFSVSTMFSAMNHFNQVNWIVQLGEHPAEISQNQATRISTVAVIGFIILAVTVVIALIALVHFLLLSKRKAYETVNLGLNDRELYGLLQGLVDDFSTDKNPQARHIHVGVSGEKGHWGVLPEGHKVADTNLKELRDTHAAEEAAKDQV